MSNRKKSEAAMSVNLLALILLISGMGLDGSIGTLMLVAAIGLFITAIIMLIVASASDGPEEEIGSDSQET